MKDKALRAALVKAGLIYTFSDSTVDATQNMSNLESNMRYQDSKSTSLQNQLELLCKYLGVQITYKPGGFVVEPVKKGKS